MKRNVSIVDFVTDPQLLGLSISKPQETLLFDRQSELWRQEQRKISAQIAVHQGANESYIDLGVRILELGQRAEILYQSQPMQERRKFLRFVFQNSTWKDRRLDPVYRKPFDFLAENSPVG